MCTIGLISPPTGMTVFVIQAQHPDIPVARIYLGTLPFLVADFVLVGLLVAAAGAGVLAAGACSRSELAPDLARDLDHPLELAPLLVLAQRVAVVGAGEAALRRQAQVLQRHVLGGLVDLALRARPSIPARRSWCVTRPSTTFLPLGSSRSGSKPPARSVSYSMK